MTTLGPSTDYTSSSPMATQGAKKTFIASMRALIADRLGVGYNLAPENVASASNVDLSAINTRQINLTGTTTVDTVTAPIGLSVQVKATGAITLKAAVTGTGADIVLAAGDSFTWRATAADTMEVLSRVPAAGFSGSKIQSITASVAANALTITVNPTTIDFRSPTANSGAVTTLQVGSAISVVIPATSNLGRAVSAGVNRIAVGVSNNAGTPVVIVNNLSGGVDLSEGGVISPTTIGAASNSSGVIYSGSAVAASSTYRIVGYVDAVFTDATGWTSISAIQGQGGQALASLSSFGNGQTWQTVTGSRAFSTTFYNTTGKPIVVSVYWPASAGNVTLTPTVNGLALNPNISAAAALISFTVPVNHSYSVANAGSGGSMVWQEQR